MPFYYLLLLLLFSLFRPTAGHLKKHSQYNVGRLWPEKGVRRERVLLYYTYLIQYAYVYIIMGRGQLIQRFKRPRPSGVGNGIQFACAIRITAKVQVE